MNKKKLCIATTIFPIALIIIACAMPSSKKEEEPVVEEPLVPYGYLIEDEDFAKTYKGFYVYRDDQLYSLNSVVSMKNREEYQFSDETYLLEFHWKKEDEVHGQKIFDAVNGVMNDDKTSVLYANTIGDFDLLKIEPTDEIRSYGVSNIELIKMESLGYGFRREMDGYSGMGIDKSDLCAGWIVTTEGKKSIPSGYYKELKYQIGDEDIYVNYNLEKDTEVTVSWYEQTDYYEYTCIADSKYYYCPSKKLVEIFGDPDSGPIKKEGTLTKDGYATYDFSDLEPGVYYLRSRENIESKFGTTYLKGYGLFIIE